jgi:hypothetical protein
MDGFTFFQAPSNFTYFYHNAQRINVQTTAIYYYLHTDIGLFELLCLYKHKRLK